MQRFVFPSAPKFSSFAAVSSIQGSSRISCRSYATQAAEEGEAEPVWPTRTLPTLKEDDRFRLTRQRNIGISAHIDSGKTTLTERVLFYTNRIKAIHEVRGKDGVGAKMDSMELEREKGITIQSAATYCDWDSRPPGVGLTEEAGVVGDAQEGKENYKINIIDTPGHVDFTIEVERALRVLDGAVLVLCSVAGVQSQTITVDRQMKRYNVPRISFINKMDRAGANPWKVIHQLRTKLKKTCAAIQVPIGSEKNYVGNVDLIRWKAVYFEGENGTSVVERDIPEELLALCEEKKAELIEQLAEVDETISDLFLDEQPITPIDIAAAVRRSTITCAFTPVMFGSAIKNTGIQSLLDGVISYLPDPSEVPAEAIDTALPSNAPKIPLVPSSDAPFLALAFKLEEAKFGQLTYMRVYQGTIRKGQLIHNARTEKKVKVPRLVRMHSNDMEDVEEIQSGEICAVFGVDCASGDTFGDGKFGTDPKTGGSGGWSMTSMFVPEPVVSLSLKIEKETTNLSKALSRFQKEDPTFRVHVDQESKETILSGMGELHLEIYVERLKREYGVVCETGRPKVTYRETISQKAYFDTQLKKQTGGSGQYAKVQGFVEPMEFDPELNSDTEFESRVVGGNIPSNYIPAVEKGFFETLLKGPLTGSPMKGIRYVLEDGAYHAVDSSEFAFKSCAITSVMEGINEADPIILEPIMTVDVVAPVEFQGAVLGGITGKRGSIIDSETREDEFTITAEVSLVNMFGYSSFLRAQTQGKGEFSMEFTRYEPVLRNVQEELVAAYRASLEKK